MGKFKDVFDIIEEKANELAEYHYTSVRNHSEITQKTIESKILFLLNSDNLQGIGEVPSRTLNEFAFDIWIVKNHKLEDSSSDIALIQDECIAIMNTFVYNMSINIIGYFPIENWTFRLVRNDTPNAFAGVRLALKIKTACNMGLTE